MENTKENIQDILKSLDDEKYTDEIDVYNSSYNFNYKTRKNK